MFLLHPNYKEEITEFARQFFATHLESFQSFESAAQATVERIFDEFRREDGSPLFVLVRVFRLGLYQDIPPDLQDRADPHISRWITLMGTRGIKADWCNRHLSNDHQLIPADSPATPMLEAAFAQIGLQFGGLNTKELSLKDDPRQPTSRYFYVSPARGSALIPAQKDFVESYGIGSVIAFGSPFVDGSAYFCVGFTQEPVDAAAADLFASINPYIGTLLANYEAPKLWD
jgi:hypothetical protein